MKISNINPHIRLVMRGKLLHGHNIRRRVIYDYELIYLEKGNFTLIYADREWQCAEGDVLFIRPGVPHSFRVDNGDISQPHIHFDMTYRLESENVPISFKDFDEMSDEEKSWIHENYFDEYPEEPFLRFKDKKAFVKLFFKVIQRKENNDPIAAKGLLTELVSLIIRDNFSDIFEKQYSYSVTSHIKDYIDAGNGFGLDLDGFARLFSYSKYHIERKFKESFGIGIIEYRNKKRMQHANRLLKTTSVSKTAELLGYSSIYSFSRAYKSYYGYSPTKATNKEQPD